MIEDVRTSPVIIAIGILAGCGGATAPARVGEAGGSQSAGADASGLHAGGTIAAVGGSAGTEARALGGAGTIAAVGGSTGTETRVFGGTRSSTTAIGGSAGSDARPHGGAAGSSTGLGAAYGMQCSVATDCRLVRNPCGCAAWPKGDPEPSFPEQCAVDWCSDLGTGENDVTCLRGQCSLGIEIHWGDVRCDMMPPTCPSDEVPLVLDDCYGPCVPKQQVMPSFHGDFDYSVLVGVWAVGWEGAQFHYSLIRFPPEIATAFDGPVEFLAAPELPNNQPFYPCSGVGRFMQNSLVGSYTLLYPEGCEASSDRTTISFASFHGARDRRGSTFAATVSTAVNTSAFEVIWYPAEICNLDMTDCDWPVL